MENKELNMIDMDFEAVYNAVDNGSMSFSQFMSLLQSKMADDIEQAVDDRLKETYFEAYDQGLNDGWDDGHAAGYDEGFGAGYEDAERQVA